MCGIMGFTIAKEGQNPTGYCDGSCATDLVHKGLRFVEYRGYDSNGIAVPDRNLSKLVVEKRTGLMQKKHNLPHSYVGIGHTRWATHGGVTDENAHPHLSCCRRLAIVHNGEVENHHELRSEIIERHPLKSQTDTEVIIHLIEDELLRNPDMPDEVAAFRVHARLKGNNAVLFMNQHLIAAMTQGSGLVLGELSNGFAASSDEQALAPFTTMTYDLPNNTLATINEKGVIYGTNGKKWNIKFEQNEQDPNLAIEKGDFDYFIEKEIAEQPETLKKLLEVSGEQVKEMAKIIKEAKDVTLLGCGTAHYATEAAKKIFALYGNKKVAVEAASEFIGQRHLILKDDLIVAFSQSGTTIDLLEETRYAKKKGAKVASFVNVKGSYLDKESDARIHLNSGVEVAVLATKSFTSMIAAAILTATEMAGNPEIGRRIVEENIEAMKEVYANRQIIKDIVDQVYDENRPDRTIFSFGRMLNYPIAKEAALKAQEGSYNPTQGYAAGEFKHGIMAMIENDTSLLAFNPEEENPEDNLDLAKEVAEALKEVESGMNNSTIQVKARAGIMIGVGPKKLEEYDFHIPVQKSGASSVLANAMVAQLFGYFLAVKRGTNPDKPRNLAKSVTVK